MDNGGRLSEQVRHSLETYFDNLDGCPAHDLYRLAMSQMERPLLDVVMKRSAGNLSRASLALGINRATLRKKLKKYGLLRAD
ncbi:MAG: Fis family transcriptional regulator [Gammaproteobacteria bacterium]|nr:Fis family transcriptional regulator [Gammaproteobacteria bacterium]MDD9864491.1 Fis family transcriptional regulator [Gammaproteobacteria bacterium]